MPIVNPSTGGSGGTSAPPARATAQFNGGNLAAGTGADVDAVLASRVVLYGLSADFPCRVRAYATAAARTADASRAVGTDPADTAGVMLDVVLTASALALLPLPMLVSLINGDAPVGQKVYFRLTNTDAVARTTTVILTYQKGE